MFVLLLPVTFPLKKTFSYHFCFIARMTTMTTTTGTAALIHLNSLEISFFFLFLVFPLDGAVVHQVELSFILYILLSSIFYRAQNNHFFSLHESKWDANTNLVWSCWGYIILDFTTTVTTDRFTTLLNNGNSRNIIISETKREKRNTFWKNKQNLPFSFLFCRYTIKKGTIVFNFHEF